jgi:hypothetical protein
MLRRTGWKHAVMLWVAPAWHLHYGTAALSNPALLTTSGPTDDFSLVLPSVGAQVSDPDKTVDKADDVKDLWDRFDSAVANQSGVSESAAALKSKLQDLKNTHANGQVGASVIATVPNQTLPFAVVVKSWGTVSVDGKVSDHDLEYLDKVADGTIPLQWILTHLRQEPTVVQL